MNKDTKWLLLRAFLKDKKKIENLSQEDITKIKGVEEFYRALDFFDKNYSDYFPLDAFASDNLDTVKLYEGERRAFFDVLERSLDFSRDDSTFWFNEFQPALARSEWVKWNQERPVHDLKALHGQSSNLGINEKFLKGQLNGQEWLTDLDLERLLDQVGLRKNILIRPLNPLDIGMSLALARKDHGTNPNPYTVNFLLNKGKTGSINSQGSHWLNASITITPGESLDKPPLKIDIVLEDSLSLSESEQNRIKEQIFNSIRYSEIVKGNPSVLYEAFPNFPINDHTVKFDIIPPKEFQKDGWSCGYRALKGLMTRIATENPDLTKQARAVIECGNDSDEIREVIYRSLLSNIQVPENNQVIPTVDDKKIEPGFLEECLKGIKTNPRANLNSLAPGALKDKIQLDEKTNEQLERIKKQFEGKVEITEKKDSEGKSKYVNQLAVSLSDLFENGNIDQKDDLTRKAVWNALVRFLNEHKVGEQNVQKLILKETDSILMPEQCAQWLEQLRYITQFEAEGSDQYLSNTLKETTARNAFIDNRNISIDPNENIWQQVSHARFSNITLCGERDSGILSTLPLTLDEDQKELLALMKERPLKEQLAYLEHHKKFFQTHPEQMLFSTLILDLNGNFAEALLETLEQHFDQGGYFPFKTIEVTMKGEEFPPKLFERFKKVLSHLKDYPGIERIDIHLLLGISSMLQELSIAQYKEISEIFQKNQSYVLLFAGPKNLKDLDPKDALIRNEFLHNPIAKYLRDKNIERRRAHLQGSEEKPEKKQETETAQPPLSLGKNDLKRACKIQGFDFRQQIAVNIDVEKQSERQYQQQTQLQQETQQEAQIAAQEENEIHTNHQGTDKGNILGKKNYLDDYVTGLNTVATQCPVMVDMVMSVAGDFGEKVWNELVGSGGLSKSVKLFTPSAMEKISAFPQYFRNGFNLDNLPSGFFVQSKPEAPNDLILCYDSTKFIENKNRSPLTPELRLKEPDGYPWRGDLRQFYPKGNLPPNLTAPQILSFNGLVSSSGNKTATLATYDQLRSFMEGLNKELSDQIQKNHAWCLPPANNAPLLPEAFTENKEIHLLMDILYHEGCEGILLFLNTLETLYKSDRDLYLHFKEHFFKDINGTRDSIIELMSDKNLSIIQKLGDLTPAQKIWWKQIVHAEHEAVGHVNLEALYDGFSYFLSKLPQNVVLPPTCPITGPGALASLDRMLAILGKVSTKNLKDQMEHLDGLDFGPEGAWYAARWEGFHFFHDKMQLNPLSFALNDKMGWEKTYRISYEQLRDAARRADIDYSDIEMCFHRYLGRASQLGVPYSAYVELTEKLGALGNVPPEIKKGFLPLLAIATTGPRGSQGFDADKLLAYIQENTRDLQKTGKLTATLSLIADVLGGLGEKPNTEELMGLIQLVNESEDSAKTLNALVEEPISVKSLQSWARWKAVSDNAKSPEQVLLQQQENVVLPEAGEKEWLPVYEMAMRNFGNYQDQWFKSSDRKEEINQLFSELDKINGHNEWSNRTKLEALGGLLEQVSERLTHTDIQFNRDPEQSRLQAEIRVVLEQTKPAKVIDEERQAIINAKPLPAGEFADLYRALREALKDNKNTDLMDDWINILALSRKDKPQTLTAEDIKTLVESQDSEYYAAALKMLASIDVEKTPVKYLPTLGQLVQCFKAFKDENFQDKQEVFKWLTGAERFPRCTFSRASSTLLPELDFDRQLLRELDQLNTRLTECGLEPWDLEALKGGNLAENVGRMYKDLIQNQLPVKVKEKINEIPVLRVMSKAMSEDKVITFVQDAVKKNAAAILESILLNPLMTAIANFPELAILKDQLAGKQPKISGDVDTILDDIQKLQDYVPVLANFFNVLADLRKTWGKSFTIDGLMNSSYTTSFTVPQLTQIFNAIEQRQFNYVPGSLLQSIFPLGKEALPKEVNTQSLTAQLTKVIQLDQFKQSQLCMIVDSMYKNVAQVDQISDLLDQLIKTKKDFPSLQSTLLKLWLGAFEKNQSKEVVGQTTKLLDLYAKSPNSPVLLILFQKLSDHPDDYQALLNQIEKVPENRRQAFLRMIAYGCLEHNYPQKRNQIFGDEGLIAQLIQAEEKAQRLESLFEQRIPPRFDRLEQLLKSENLEEDIQKYELDPPGLRGKPLFKRILTLPHNRLPEELEAGVLYLCEEKGKGTSKIIAYSLSNKPKILSRDEYEALMPKMAENAFRRNSAPIENQASIGEITSICGLTYLDQQFDISTIHERIDGILDLGRSKDGKDVPLFQEQRQRLYDAVAYITAVGRDHALTKCPLELQKAVKDLSAEEIRQLVQHYRTLISNEGTSDQDRWLAQIEFITLMREVLYRPEGKFAYDTQILCALNLILQGGNVFSEIRTGEGKSLITALFAALKWAEGGAIDVCSSGIVLAARDLEECKDFFDYLGIPTALIQANSPHAVYQQDGINYSDIPNMTLFQEQQLLDDELLPEKVSLILDEVDWTVLDNTTQFRYATSLESGFDPHFNPNAWVYPLILEFVKDPKWFMENGCSKAGDIEKLRDFIKQHPGLNKSQKGLFLDFSDELLDRWIDSAYIASRLQEGEDFAIREEKMMKGEDEVEILVARVKINHRESTDSKFSDGVHQFLHARLNLEMNQNPNFQPSPRGRSFPIEPEKTYLASRSSRNTMNYYLGSENGKPPRGNVIGLTGSMGSLDERFELERSYAAKFFRIPPHRPLLRKDLGVHLARRQGLFIKESAEKAHFREIYKAILRAQARGESILIICDGVKSSSRLNDYLAKKIHKDQLQLHNGEQLEQNEKEVTQKAGLAGMVTISTPMFGRGTDIKPETSLHVIRTVIAEEREDVQNIGRAARNGQYGSTELVLSETEFTMRGRKVPGNTPLLNQAIKEVRLEMAQKKAKERFERELFANLKDQFFTQYVDLCRTMKRGIGDQWKPLRSDPRPVWEKVSYKSHVEWESFLRTIDKEWQATLTRLKNEGQLDDPKAEKARLEQAIEQLAQVANQAWGKTHQKILKDSNETLNKAYGEVYQKIEKQQSVELPEDSKLPKIDLSDKPKVPKQFEHSVKPVSHQFVEILTPVFAMPETLDFRKLNPQSLNIEKSYLKVSGKVGSPEQKLDILDGELDAILQGISDKKFKEETLVTDKISTLTKTILSTLHTAYLPDGRPDPQFIQFDSALKELLTTVSLYGEDSDKQALLKAFNHAVTEVDARYSASRFSNQHLLYLYQIKQQLKEAGIVAPDEAKILIPDQKAKNVWEEVYQMTREKLSRYARLSSWKSKDRETAVHDLLEKLKKIHEGGPDDILILEPEQKLSQLMQALNETSTQLLTDDLTEDQERILLSPRNQEGSRLQNIIHKALAFAFVKSVSIEGDDKQKLLGSQVQHLKEALGKLQERTEIARLPQEVKSLIDSMDLKFLDYKGLMLARERLAYSHSLLAEKPKLNPQQKAFMHVLENNLKQVDTVLQLLVSNVPEAGEAMNSKEGKLYMQVQENLKQLATKDILEHPISTASINTIMRYAESLSKIEASEGTKYLISVALFDIERLVSKEYRPIKKFQYTNVEYDGDQLKVKATFMGEKESFDFSLVVKGVSLDRQAWICEWPNIGSKPKEEEKKVEEREGQLSSTKPPKEEEVIKTSGVNQGPPPSNLGEPKDPEENKPPKTGLVK